MKQKNINKYLQNITLPAKNSHKGQNGKLLIIGGSQLFHAASKWSLDIASKFVDMIFYSSIPSNNQLIQEAKQNFWNGIVVPREELENYFEEADCILIGPGMERTASGDYQKNPSEGSQASARQRQASTERLKLYQQTPSNSEWQNNTEKITNYLLAKYPNKQWIIDAGALQMIDPALLNKNCIITPHERELSLLLAKLEQKKQLTSNQVKKTTQDQENILSNYVQLFNQSTILLKGPVDYVAVAKKCRTNTKTDTKKSVQVIAIPGGNPGMTKGGTGDVLAGLVAALYCTHDALTSAVVASYINKKAGDKLYKKVGPYFNASDLVEMVPEVMWQELSSSHN